MAVLLSLPVFRKRPRLRPRPGCPLLCGAIHSGAGSEAQEAEPGAGLNASTQPAIAEFSAAESRHGDGLPELPRLERADGKSRPLRPELVPRPRTLPIDPAGRPDPFAHEGRGLLRSNNREWVEP